MRIRLSRDVIKELKRIKKNNKRLIKQVERQLILFTQNPKHPSLRTHKLSGKLHNLWSISITRSIRIVYILLKEDEAYFVDIGTHDKVYRK